MYKKDIVTLEMTLELAKEKGYEVEFLIGGWCKVTGKEDYYIGSNYEECYYWLKG